MDKLALILIEKTKNLLDEAIMHRRHFHMHPELSFKEILTAKYIIEYLEDNNINHTILPDGKGIIASIDGNRKAGKTIALRAEMDALPISENSGLDYASKNKGIMHACGHDAHMAMLLASIKILNDMRDEFNGKIGFIFQPGEELAPGGAASLIETDEFKALKPDLIIAQHVLPGLRTGVLGFTPGKYMASSDEIHILISGIGGHAALPEKCTDQVLIGSELVIKLKDKIGRLNTNSRIIFNIGRFSAEGATNIIPENVIIKGTLRTFDENDRQEIIKTVNEICNAIQYKRGVKIDLEIPPGYPVLINDQKHTEMASRMAAEINGPDSVKEIEPRMSSEDFAHYSKVSPVVFFRTGVASDALGNKGLHSPDFTIDEKAFETGIRTISYLAVNFAKH